MSPGNQQPHLSHYCWDDLNIQSVSVSILELFLKLIYSYLLNMNWIKLDMGIILSWLTPAVCAKVDEKKKISRQIDKEILQELKQEAGIFMDGRKKI